MLSLAAREIHPSCMNIGYVCCKRCCLSDWRATYMLANVTLVLAILCVYGAFVAAAVITFDAAQTTWKVCTIVGVVATFTCAVWLLFGPFSICRCVVRSWHKGTEAVLRPSMTKAAASKDGVGSPNAKLTGKCCCCLGDPLKGEDV